MKGVVSAQKSDAEVVRERHHLFPQSQSALANVGFELHPRLAHAL